MTQSAEQQQLVLFDQFLCASPKASHGALKVQNMDINWWRHCRFV